MFSVSPAEIDPLIPKADDIAVPLALGMKRLAGFPLMRQVVGRHRLNGKTRHGLNLAVFHDYTPRRPVGAEFIHHDLGLGLPQHLHDLGIQMVTVLVGNEDQVSLGELAVIRILPHRVHVDGLALEGKHQGPMADKAHFQGAGIGMNNICLERFGGSHGGSS